MYNANQHEKSPETGESENFSFNCAATELLIDELTGNEGF